MRIKHNLWRVKNGWILVPEGIDGYCKSEDAEEISVFKTLKEFADTYPKRERKARKPKTATVTLIQKDIQHADQH